MGHGNRCELGLEDFPEGRDRSSIDDRDLVAVVVDGEVRKCPHYGRFRCVGSGCM